MGKQDNDEDEGGKQSQYLTPGVYVEEVLSGSRPIESVGTAVAAFVGLSPFSLGRIARTVALAAVVASLLRKVR
jgi:phage tail sheath protein FI